MWDRRRVVAVCSGALALAALACAPAQEPAPPAHQAPAPSTRALPITRSPGGAAELSPEALLPLLGKVRIVDVREDAELRDELGHLPGVLHVPLADLNEAAAAWSTEEPLVLICRSGRRSARAVEALEAQGFRRVASLTGGMLAWSARGLPASRASDDFTRGALPSARPQEPSSNDTSPIQALLQEPGAIAWVKVASLLEGGVEACVDGRTTHPVIGTPGGDAGELLLALATLERLTRQTLDEPAVQAELDAYIDAFGRFYLHTDAHAMERLGHDLASHPALARWKDQLLDPERLERWVRHPPAEAEDALLDALTSPQHVGCGHLRLMLQHPDAYGARPDLVRAVLRAAFLQLWRHPERVLWEILEGEHGERGVLLVTQDAPLRAFSRVPAVRPAHRDLQLFIDHPAVTDFMRQQNAWFFLDARRLPLTQTLDPADFMAALNALAEQQLLATLDRLALGLPRYEAQLAPAPSPLQPPVVRVRALP